MIFHKGSSVGLNYSLFKFSLSSKVGSKHVSSRHSSWHYMTIGQLRWKKYNDNRKLFKKVIRTFPGLSTSSPYIRQNSNFFSRNSEDNPYLITVTNFKTTVNSQDYIIRKTVGKLRNRIPLSDIDVEKNGLPSEFEPSTSTCDVPTPGQSVPSLNSLSLDDRSNTFIGKAKHTNTIHNYNKDSQKSEKSDINNLLPLDYEFWENNENKKVDHKNNPDTLILNPQNPDSRMILHFKNKSIQIIEPSNFDHLNLAHQHIMKMNKINAYNKAGRINFTTFEKIPTTDLIKTREQSEFKSFQEGVDLDFTILKKEESVCLEDNSNRCWIPVINEAKSPINLQNKEELCVSGKEDANDIHITKIPIKKNTLIEENVIPDKSILNIINSIDKSAVIIQKDLYITNRIIQSIKEEEKNKDKKKLETKGIFPNENIVLRLVAISKEGMTSENSQRLNKTFCEHDNMLSQLNDIMKLNSGGIYLIKTSKDNKRLELLFTLVGTPDFQKGPSTTDIINKAAAIIEKEKYHQKKLDEESNEKSKSIVGEERNLKKLERIEHNKSKDRDKCSLPSDIVWGNSLVLLKLCKDSRPFPNFPQCSTDLNMNLNVITPHEKPFEEGIDTLNPTLENLIPEGKPNSVTDCDTPNKKINNLEDQGFAKSKNNESNSTVDDTKNELSITNGIEQSVIENENIFLNSMIRENLDSFECASLVDNSIKCLMSSQAKKGKGGNQGKLGNNTNNLPTKFPTRNDKTAGGHCSTTNITVFKNNNLTDINISEKEIFTDPRIPVSFSTETSFQIVGSNSKVRKEMDLFEKAKSMLLSSIVQTKHDSNSSNKNILNSKPLSVDLYSFSKNRDKPPTKENNSKRKSISITRNEKKKMVSNRKRIRQDRLYNGKNLPPDINKLEGNADTSSKPKTKLKSQDEDVKAIKETNIVPEKVKSNINESKIEPPKTVSEQEISNNNFNNNYVHLLQGSNKEITAKPKKPQLKGITEHKSLSKRDKLILKELIKATKKNKQIKQKEDSGDTKSFSINKKKQLKETFKSSEDIFDSSKIKINKSPIKITVKQTLPNTKENEVKPSLITENVKTSKTDGEIKIATSDQISKIKKIQTKPKLPEENKQDSNITNTKLDIKNATKIIKNQIDGISDKKIPQSKVSDRDYISISKRNDGSTSLRFGPSAETEEGQVSNPPESQLPLAKPQGKDLTFTEIQPKQTDNPITHNKNVRDTPKSEIVIIEHTNKNTPQDDQNQREIFKNNLLSKIKSKIESKNPINYRAKKEKVISTYDKKLAVNETIQKKLEDNITSKKHSETSNKNKLNEDTSNKNISKKNISLKSIKSPVKNVIQDKETFDKKSLVTKHITGPIKKFQEKNPQEHLPQPKARDFSDVLNSPNITRKIVKSKSRLDIKQKHGKAEEMKKILTGKSAMLTHKLEQTSKMAQQKNKQTIMDAVLAEPITKGKLVTANQKAKQGDNNVTKPKNLTLGPSVNLRNSPVKSSISQKQRDTLGSQKEAPAEGIFPTLIVDIDKMNKEIKPNFNIKKCRTCSIPPEKIIHFPIRNSKKVKQQTHSHSVIKVCPSKDPQLNNELARFPSVTKVLNVTLPKMSKELLKTWWRDKMQNMGEEGFKSLYKGEMTSGTQFHNLIQDHLLWGGGGAIPSSLSFKSLHHILKDIKDLSVINSHVVHNTLAYRGVIDCVATFKKKPVVIEWKRLNRKEYRSKTALESAFQQLSAYIGAINFDSNYKFQVNNGLLVLAYNDGSEADHFVLGEADCEIYWKLWLERLQRYHAYIKNKSNKQ